jgi:hypothetical protein
MSFEITMSNAFKAAAEQMVNVALTHALRKLSAQYGFDEDEAATFLATDKVTVVPELLPASALPWCGECVPGKCTALAFNRGLYTQCPMDIHADDLCKKCHKQKEKEGTLKHGDVESRNSVGPMEYRNATVRPFSDFMTKQNWSRDLVERSAAALGWTVPEANFEKKKRRGRPAMAAMAAPALPPPTVDWQSQESDEAADEQASVKKDDKKEKPKNDSDELSAEEPHTKKTEELAKKAEEPPAQKAEEPAKKAETPLTRDIISSMNLGTLKSTCIENGISIDGKKPNVLKKELTYKLGV